MVIAFLIALCGIAGALTYTVHQLGKLTNSNLSLMSKRVDALERWKHDSEVCYVDDDALVDVFKEDVVTVDEAKRIVEETHKTKLTEREHVLFDLAFGMGQMTTQPEEAGQGMQGLTDGTQFNKDFIEPGYLISVRHKGDGDPVDAEPINGVITTVGDTMIVMETGWGRKHLTVDEVNDAEVVVADKRFEQYLVRNIKTTGLAVVLNSNYLHSGNDGQLMQ